MSTQIMELSPKQKKSQFVNNWPQSPQLTISLEKGRKGILVVYGFGLFFGLLAFWPQCLAFFPVCILASFVNKEAKIQTGKKAKHWGQKAKRPKTRGQNGTSYGPNTKARGKKHVHPFQKLVIDWVFTVNFHFSLNPSYQRGRVYKSKCKSMPFQIIPWLWYIALLS